MLLFYWIRNLPVEDTVFTNPEDDLSVSLFQPLDAIFKFITPVHKSQIVALIELVMCVSFTVFTFKIDMNAKSLILLH